MSKPDKHDLISLFDRIGERAGFSSLAFKLGNDAIPLRLRKDCFGWRRFMDKCIGVVLLGRNAKRIGQHMTLRDHDAARQIGEDVSTRSSIFMDFPLFRRAVFPAVQG